MLSPTDVLRHTKQDGSCRVWARKALNRGYPSITVNKKVRRGNRLMWELVHGPIPEGMHVLHTCDNRLCLNPEHLFLGTCRSNMEDKVAKGRQIKGTDHPKAKLSNEDVRSIRFDKRTQSLIAKEYGVHQTLISAIKTGKIWRHV